MKKNNFKRFLSLLIISVLSIGALAFTGCNSVDKDLSKDSFGIHGFSNNGIVLTSNEATVVNTGTSTYLEKTLTATINVTTVDKYLYWNVAWENGNAQDINEYIQVVPTVEGGTIAKVRCYKSFESLGNAIISVTARINGLSASCTAYYVGRPTALKIGANNSGGTLNVHSGASYSFDLTPINEFGVGSIYGKEYVVEPYVTGGLTGNVYKVVNGTLCDDTTKYDYESRVSIQKTSTTSKTSISYDIDNGTYKGELDCSYMFDPANYFSYSITGNKLVITPKNGWINRYPVQLPRSGVVFVPAGQLSNITIGFKVMDTKDRTISAVMNLNISDGLTTLTLSNNSLSF